MNSCEERLQKARSLSVSQLAQSIQDIGFECTDCGECCKSSDDEDHVATVFPDEVRSIKTGDESWADVAKPMPFGLLNDGTETFEWSLQTDECGNCVFFDDTADNGGCTRYSARPLICQTYPFSVEFEEPENDYDVVEQSGNVVAHECEGLGEDISRSDAIALAEALKRRLITEIKEEQAVIATYRSKSDGADETVVYDSEGVKRPDGSIVSDANPSSGDGVR
jgi:Fe-S-cluster containining protein